MALAFIYKTNDYTAIISLKLINFCRILVYQIFRKPSVLAKTTTVRGFPDHQGRKEKKKKNTLG